MSYARRHSTNMCLGNRVRYTVSGQLLTDASTLWGVGLSLTYHF